MSEVGTKFLAELMAALDGALDPALGLLRTHLFLEQAITQALEGALAEPQVLLERDAGLRFHQRARALRSIGLLSEGTLCFLLELNSLRNRFAHKLGYQLTEKDVNKLGALCPDHYRQFRSDNSEDLMTCFNKTISILVGRVCGELEGGERLLAEMKQ